jgi:phenylpyruvate tautomerase PptA (4-oxalocrotonate tautomerase family)
LIKSFLTDGDVDFGKSDTEAEPCKVYIIFHDVNGEDYQMQAENCSEQVVIKTMEKAL